MTGWLLGGTIGLGTVLFAVLIGPIVHVSLPLFDRGAGARMRPAPDPRASDATAAARLSAPGT